MPADRPHDRISQMPRRIRVRSIAPRLFRETMTRRSEEHPEQSGCGRISRRLGNRRDGEGAAIERRTAESAGAAESEASRRKAVGGLENKRTALVEVGDVESDQGARGIAKPVEGDGPGRAAAEVQERRSRQSETSEDFAHAARALDCSARERDPGRIVDLIALRDEQRGVGRHRDGRKAEGSPETLSPA